MIHFLFSNFFCQARVQELKAQVASANAMIHTNTQHTIEVQETLADLRTSMEQVSSTPERQVLDSIIYSYNFCLFPSDASQRCRSH